jgi:hypothetical protein
MHDLLEKEAGASRQRRRTDSGGLGWSLPERIRRRELAIQKQQWLGELLGLTEGCELETPAMVPAVKQNQNRNVVAQHSKLEPILSR